MKRGNDGHLIILEDGIDKIRRQNIKTIGEMRTLLRNKIGGDYGKQMRGQSEREREKGGRGINKKY